MFFVLDMENQCWHHTRCDKEIAHYKQQLTTASKAGKASALKRAMSKNPTGVEQALDERSTEVQPTNNHKPITTNHIKEKQQRGSRLAQDWVLTNPMDEWAKQERPDLDVRQVVEQFKDYWISQPGQKGVKLDWDATWRNWVRNTKAVKPNPYDVGRTTVASKNEPNLALLKIEEDAKKAAPIPLEVLAKMAQIRQKA
jgi:hypothetical protein